MDKTLQEEGLKMASMRAEAKEAAMYTFESPLSRKMHDRVDDHQQKLQEHRNKLDQHKMYLLQIATDVDRLEREEDMTSVPTINRKSRELVQDSRNIKVEDILLEKGKSYAAKVDEARLKQEAEESGKNTYQPAICATSKKLHLKQPVQKRLIQYQDTYKTQLAKAKADEIQKQNTRLAQDEKSRVVTILGKTSGETPAPQKGVPVITERSQRKHREYHDCLQWGEEQKKKQEELREKFDEMEMAEVRSKPVISQRSKKLAEKQDREAKIEDTLLAYKDKKLEKQEEKKQMQEVEECPHHPQITNYAAQLEREGDIGERLYNKAFEYRAKRAEEVERQMCEIEEMARGVHRSPPRLASYSFEYKHEPEARTLPIELDLQRREAEKQALREQAAQERDEEEAVQHYPRINAMSDLIAQQLPETSVERLLKPKTVWAGPEETEENDPNLTFRPHVNQRSVEINNEKLARGEVSTDRNEYLFQKDEENKYRMEQARKRALDKEMEECTFQPNINRASSYTPALQSNCSVVARTQQWQKQRNARMRQEREAQDKKEMEECTFRPNIGKYKPKKKAPAKADAYGVDTHIDRQASARKQKEDAVEIPHSTGEGWQNKVTEPKEFSFNHKVKIKALSKPITASIADEEIEKKKQRQREAALELSPSVGSHASAEWMRRAAEKEMSEHAHSAAGMNSPRYYASDALNAATGTPRGRTGEDAYIQRMKAARAEKEMKEAAAASTTGNKWTPGTTKPKEFKFSASKALKVKSLHKPVSPMVGY